MPQLRSLQDKYSRQMVILGVDTGERADSPQAQAALGTAAARRFQLNYPVLLNGDPVMGQYEASGLPTTYLIDPGGRIVVAQVGASAERSEERRVGKGCGVRVGPGQRKESTK